jgi:hypothetical protein
MSSPAYRAVIVENEFQVALSACAAGQWRCGPVYRKAAYYSWPAFGPVVLLTHGQPPGPGAIVTDVPEFDVGGVLHADRLDSASLRAGILSLPQGIQVQMGDARTYDAALPNLAGKWWPEAAKLAKRIGWGEQATFLSHLGPLEEVFSARVKLLAQGLVALEQETIRPACRSLVGLGYGATPSGDDFLTGVLSVLASAGTGQEFGLLAKCLLELRMDTSTTVPGQVELRYACQKRVSQPIREAVLALHALGSGEKAFEQLVRIGHTSGRDIMAGMLLAGVMLRCSRR